jgi:hypothetical protein
MKYQGKAVSQGGVKVQGKKPVLFGLRRAVPFVEKIETRFPDRREFSRRRVFGKGGVPNWGVPRSGLRETPRRLGVDGEARKNGRRPVPPRGGGQFPVNGKFFPVPGACRGGYTKAAADAFGLRFQVEQVL